MKEQIQTWLKDNGSYRDGYYLLEKIGADDSILRQIRAGLDLPYVKPALKDLLKKSLQGILDSLPAGVPIISAAAEPQAVKDLRDQAKMLHKEHAHLKARLTIAATDDERYDLADTIMAEIIPKLDDIYDRIREWESTGRVRGESRQEIVSEVMAKINRRGSIRSILSRLKKQLEGDMNFGDRQDAEKKQAELLVELEEIDQFLGLSD